MQDNIVHVEGMGGLSMHQVEVWASTPGIFFANISAEKGILGQFYGSQEIRLKSIFTEIR